MSGRKKFFVKKDCGGEKENREISPQNVKQIARVAILRYEHQTVEVGGEVTHNADDIFMLTDRFHNCNLLKELSDVLAIVCVCLGLKIENLSDVTCKQPTPNPN